MLWIQNVGRLFSTRNLSRPTSWVTYWLKFSCFRYWVVGSPVVKEVVEDLEDYLENVDYLKSLTTSSPKRCRRTLFLPHRFIKIRPSHQRPVSIEWFQKSPNLSKIEKVAETCEFDRKEPLFVERTIAISIRVLGWDLLLYIFKSKIHPKTLFEICLNA